MFNNREVRVRLAKTDDTPTNTEEQKPFMTKEEADAILKDMIKHTAIAVVCVMGASVILHTAGELVIRAAENASK